MLLEVETTRGSLLLLILWFLDVGDNELRNDIVEEAAPLQINKDGHHSHGNIMQPQLLRMIFISLSSINCDFLD